MNTYPLILQMMALISGLLAIKAMRPDFRILVALLGLTVINEAVVIPYLSHEKRGYVNLAYNIFSIIDMTVWFLLLYRIFQSAQTRKIITVTAVLIAIITVLEITWLKGWKDFHTDSMRLYNISVVLICLHYFYLLLIQRYHRFFVNPLFWISTAAFIYHTILFLNFTTLSDHNYWKMKYAAEVYYLLQNIGNTCYYLLLIAAFGCWKYLSRKDRAPYQHS